MAPGANPERWQRLDRVFQQALDLPASEREAYLREACGEDGAFLPAGQLAQMGAAEIDPAVGAAGDGEEASCQELAMR